MKKKVVCEKEGINAFFKTLFQEEKKKPIQPMNPTTIKLICFDLDGVLISSRNWHFESLNQALLEYGGQFAISQKEHCARFDGLPTTKKLSMLHRERGLPEEVFESIWARKQDVVTKIIESEVQVNPKLVDMMKTLKAEDYRLVCCSNSIASTLNLVLIRLGIFHFFDAVYSNDHKKYRTLFPLCAPKPFPGMYMYACLEAGISPRETLVCEDSPVGQRAALEAGCWLCTVESPEHLTLDLIHAHLVVGPSLSPFKNPRWVATPNMNVLIPMAGRGSRFACNGYREIKPMIDTVNGLPMIALVIRNLNIGATHIFIAQDAHIQEYRFDKWLPVLVGSAPTIIIGTSTVTQGTACSTLLAKNEINNDNPLLIANSDQFIDCDMNLFLYRVMSNGVDGGMLTFEVTEHDNKWSFAEMEDETGFVKHVHEKVQVGTHANVGIYFWKRGSDYVKYAEQMINDERNKVNGEFYVAPVYNLAIKDQKRIIIFPVKKMYGLGVPEDLLKFQSSFSGSI